jgi:hypothetical protein
MMTQNRGVANPLRRENLSRRSCPPAVRVIPIVLAMALVAGEEKVSDTLTARVSDTFSSLGAPAPDSKWGRRPPVPAEPLDARVQRGERVAGHRPA